MALRTKRADGIDITDPVEQVSLAGWFAFSVAILMASTVWAIYEEVAGLRPWKATQQQFKVAATAHLQKQLRDAEGRLAEVLASPEYRESQAAVSDAEKGFEATAGQRQELKDKQAAKQAELAQVRAELKSIRSEYQAAIYQWEQADEAGKAKWIEQIKSREDKVLELIAKMTAVDDEVNTLARDIFAFSTDLNEARAKEAEFRAEVARISGQLESIQGQDIGIVQYYVPELDHATDRCATCHIGAVTPGLETIEETLAGMPEFSYDVEKYSSLFKTHPGDHLVKHPPEKFGCVSCHAGDGPSLTSVWEAHGTHHHHEAPLFKSPTNAPKAFGHVAEAGCNKCHQNELEIPGAPLLSFGKQLFSETCSGCHKAKGIAAEQDLLDNAQKALGRAQDALMQAKARAADLTAEQDELNRLYDEEIIGDDEYDKRDKVIMAAKDEVRIDQVQAEESIRIAKLQVDGAHKDIRWIGPDLRNVKEKLRPSWLKEWLLDPHAFSEKTKMPNFSLTENEAESLAAYLWQSAREPQRGFDRRPPRDEETIEKGEKLFTSSGCLACHVGGEENGQPIDIRPSFGTDEAGNPIKKRGFGPELLRTGEKARFDWMSRWIHDPYSMSPGTRMPNLRLQKDQADAIAAWLVTQNTRKGEAGEWDLRNAPDYLEDEKKAEDGYALVQRYGCYSCHAISDKPPGDDKPAGWEDGDLMSERFGRIGVELSAHGSKTLHLFDFGLIEHQVQENMWGDEYHPNVTRFDYIAYKAWKPKDFEQGRYYTGPSDPAHLRMPSLNLSREEAHALATFVVSLVEEPVPATYIYKPGYPGSAVAEGRNVTVKHNCVACHSMEEDRGGYLRDRYKDLNNAPPTLVGEGRRIQPDWFFDFMKTPFHLRPWLEVRMPNFRLSDREAEILSAYFQGYDNQPYPYVSRPKPELTAAEEREASEILVGQCARCHSLEETYDPKGQAPMLDMAKERIKPEWVAPWVLNPQKFIPYTRMPNLGLSAKQAQLVSDYLQTLNEEPARVGEYEPDEFHRAHEPALITEN